MRHCVIGSLLRGEVMQILPGREVSVTRTRRKRPTYIGLGPTREDEQRIQTAAVCEEDVGLNAVADEDGPLPVEVGAAANLVHVFLPRLADDDGLLVLGKRRKENFQERASSGCRPAILDQHRLIVIGADESASFIGGEVVETLCELLVGDLSVELEDDDADGGVRFDARVIERRKLFLVFRVGAASPLETVRLQFFLERVGTDYVNLALRFVRDVRQDDVADVTCRRGSGCVNLFELDVEAVLSELNAGEMVSEKRNARNGGKVCTFSRYSPRDLEPLFVTKLTFFPVSFRKLIVSAASGVLSGGMFSPEQMRASMN